MPANASKARPRTLEYALSLDIMFPFTGRPLSPSLALFALLFSSCTTFTDLAHRNADRVARLNAREKHEAFRDQPGWKKETFIDEAVLSAAAPGNSRIVISLEAQRGYLLVDDRIAIDFPVATGMRSHPTPTGEFTILHKKRHHRSNLYGRILDGSGEVVRSDADTRSHRVPAGGRFVGASMPYWMRLTNSGVGLHVGYVPGRPASHGCIRMPAQVAPKIFERMPVGAPVKIVDSVEPAELGAEV